MTEKTSKKTVLPQTETFLSSLKLLNSIAGKFLPKLLGPILSNLHDEDLLPFDENSIDKILNKLKLNKNELQTIIDSSSFIFETCAQYNLKPSKLKNELLRGGLDEIHSSAFEKVWSEKGPEFVEKLKESCFAPRILKDINWSLQMSVASQNNSMLREPRALFQIKTGNPNYNKNGTINNQNEEESFFMELNLQELTNLFNDLEKIQQQLDTLS